MENVTLLSVNAAYGLAVLLFAIAAARRSSVASARMPDAPPEIPVGKVQVWAYRSSDLIALAAIVAVFYLLAMTNSVAGQEKAKTALSAEMVMFSIGFQIFTALIVLAVVVSRVNPVKWLGLAWKQWPLVFLIAPVTVMSMWALFAGLQMAGYMDLMDKLGVEKVQETVTIFQTEKDMTVVLLLAFAAAIVAPVCEEIVFRGYLYPVAKKFAGPWMAGLCSALVFSAAHGSLPALLPLFAFGLVLAAIYEFTGSIWAPMAVHFVFNGATVVVQLLPRLNELPETILK